VDRLVEVDRLVKGDIYPVGSGDAFMAGLVTALDRGDAWEDARRLGLGAGAANAEMPGAARLDPDRARALASQAEIHLL
jgi:sugar/nucleoside kinase (ribokinase family)